jgi:hypothetical protein
MCLALVAHELVGLLVHSPGQLDTWLVARCMKGEWEWKKWEKAVVVTSSSRIVLTRWDGRWISVERGHVRGVSPSAASCFHSSERQETVNSSNVTNHPNIEFLSLLSLSLIGTLKVIRRAGPRHLTLQQTAPSRQPSSPPATSILRFLSLCFTNENTQGRCTGLNWQNSIV